jgi:hypothetical protein
MSDILKKVYVITVGDYSDYTIVMICDTKECAQKAVELYSRDQSYHSGYNIEEWDMNTRKPEDMQPCWIWHYNIETNVLDRLERYGYNETGIVNYIESKKLLVGHVLAKNEEVAKKIIYDLVAQKKSEMQEVV